MMALGGTLTFRKRVKSHFFSCYLLRRRRQNCCNRRQRRRCIRRCAVNTPVAPSYFEEERDGKQRHHSPHPVAVLCASRFLHGSVWHDASTGAIVARTEGAGSGAPLGTGLGYNCRASHRNCKIRSEITRSYCVGIPHVYPQSSVHWLLWINTESITGVHAWVSYPFREHNTGFQGLIPTMHGPGYRLELGTT